MSYWDLFLTLILSCIRIWIISNFFSKIGTKVFSSFMYTVYLLIRNIDFIFADTLCLYILFYTIMMYSSVTVVISVFCIFAFSYMFWFLISVFTNLSICGSQVATNTPLISFHYCEGRDCWSLVLYQNWLQNFPHYYSNYYKINLQEEKNKR